MSGRNPNDVRSRWSRELASTSECIPIERLAEELTPAEHSHLAHCVRCQTELSLWHEMNEPDATAEESAAVQAIAADVRARMTASPSNVIAMRGRNAVPFRPAALAAAAVLVIALGIGLFVQSHQPSIEGPASVVSAYRSASVEVISPSGDLASPPKGLRWKPVTGADTYDVEVMEVDHAALWHSTTREAHIELPESLVAQFVPGKTVLWQVKARRDRSIVADSGVQRFRVTPTR